MWLTAAWWRQKGQGKPISQRRKPSYTMGGELAFSNPKSSLLHFISYALFSLLHPRPALFLATFPPCNTSPGGSPEGNAQSGEKALWPPALCAPWPLRPHGSWPELSPFKSLTRFSSTTSYSTRAKENCQNILSPLKKRVRVHATFQGPIF